MYVCIYEYIYIWKNGLVCIYTTLIPFPEIEAHGSNGSGESNAESTDLKERERGRERGPAAFNSSALAQVCMAVTTV